MRLFIIAQLQESFGVNMLALVDGAPKILSLRQVIHYYLEHQKDVVTRRTRFDLDKAMQRAHILEGLLTALDHIDAVISLIRASRTAQEARDGLMSRFGLSERQAQAILDMRFQRLTGMEREKLKAEYDDLQKFLNPQFRVSLRHFCVINPRLSAAKPSGLFLELTQNLLELADCPA